MQIEALRTAIALGAFWAFVCWFYRHYREDLLKQHLFGLRDELFDLARAGIIAFDHPAYGLTRSAINGMLLSAERLNLVWLVTSNFASRDPDVKELERSYRARWEAALESLPVGVRNDITTIRDRLNVRLVDHLFFTSPLLWPLVLPVTVLVLSFMTIGMLFGGVRIDIHREVARRTGVEDLDMIGTAIADDPSCLVPA